MAHNIPIPQPVTRRYGDAAVAFDGSVLSAEAGGLRRHWRWTGHGLRSETVEHAGRSWRLAGEDQRDADWELPVCEGRNPEAVLISARAFVGDDDGFTAPHAGLEVEMAYPAVHLALRFAVWAYPGAAGLRTQLQVRAMPGYAFDAGLDRREVSEAAQRIRRIGRGGRRLDLLPLDFGGTVRRLIGYHSDTQNRNDPHLDLLLEGRDARPLTHPAVCAWANACCVEADGHGLALVKESHRTVNCHGHDTGEFVCLPGLGLIDTGWGILASEIDGRWRPAWATWSLAWTGGDRARQEAFKRFDGLRYPVKSWQIRPQANTWGSSQGWLEHREAAGEAAVLAEIDSCADLGVEVLQIDDGWQGDGYASWTPHAGRHPHGWGPVRERAKARGVDLGLWMSVQDIAKAGPTLEETLRCAEDGGFIAFKFDFAVLNGRAAIDGLMERARALIADRRHGVQVDWDLTEVIPRYGHFFAREYGRIHLSNRKPVLPRSTVYRPGTMLRDLWQLAHYVNLFKYQGTIQNPADVDRSFSDIAAYGIDYCAAIALMSSPLLFCQTTRIAAADRDRLRPLLAAQCRVRDELVQGIVHPLGERPDGTRWTGFECALPGDAGGFLLVFREPWSEEPRGRLALPHLAGRRLRLEDQLSGEANEATVAADGRLCIDLERPGSFRFLRHRLLA